MRFINKLSPKETKKINYNLRINETNYNNNHCLMKIIEYYSAKDILVEFQDKFKFKTKSTYSAFKRGEIKNPYYPSVQGVGIIGTKYKTSEKGKHIKEYDVWKSMITRCYDNKIKERCSTYKNVTCCKEWLLYENFYEWIHEQENYDKWINGERWDLDKDILVKGNKLYSPKTCCLVPNHVNKLFTKADKLRNNNPIGVIYRSKKNMYEVNCSDKQFFSNSVYLGMFTTPEDAFYLGYKPYKENHIKQIAQEEYNKGNITKNCYNAMINYKVEITD